MKKSAELLQRISALEMERNDLAARLKQMSLNFHFVHDCLELVADKYDVRGGTWQDRVNNVRVLLESKEKP